jgi:hypothetical protein
LISIKKKIWDLSKKELSKNSKRWNWQHRQIQTFTHFLAVRKGSLVSSRAVTDVFVATNTTKVGSVKLRFYERCQGLGMIFITFCRFCAIPTRF